MYTSRRTAFIRALRVAFRSEQRNDRTGRVGSGLEIEVQIKLFFNSQSSYLGKSLFIVVEKCNFERQLESASRDFFHVGDEPHI